MPYIYRTVKVSRAERPTVRVVRQAGRVNVTTQKGSPNQVRVTPTQRNVRVLSDLAGVAAALNERLQAVIEDGGRTALNAPRTTGTSTDYQLVTTGAPILTLYDGLGVALTPHVSNDEAPVTLTVDSTPTKPILLSTLNSGYRDLSPDMLRQGVPVWAHYLEPVDAWVIGLVRRAASDLVLDGSVTTPLIGESAVTVDRLSADVFNANNINAGKLSSRYVEITELLEIDEITAGFSMGKSSAFDDADGIYMGRANDDGIVGFGLAFSRMESDREQSVKATSRDGLKITNASFYRNLEVPGAFTPYDDTSQVTTVPLPAGTLTMAIELAGAGGGGAAGVGNGQSPGTPATAGGDTTIQLRDDSGLIQTWTATGGAAGVTQSSSGGGLAGENAPTGTGGEGGDRVNDGYEYNPILGFYYPTYTFTEGQNATGYGAGGGGGAGNDRGAGGEAGQFLSFEQIDVSGLSNPYVEITVGAAGVGGTYAGADGADGGDGSQGRARVLFEDTELLPANVVPLAPTSTGTMSNHGPFPDLGAGFWVLWIAGSNNVGLGDIEIDDNGSTFQHVSGSSVSFVSAKTPIVLSTPNSSRTINYIFHKMGD